MPRRYSYLVIAVLACIVGGLPLWPDDMTGTVIRVFFFGGAIVALVMALIMPINNTNDGGRA